MNKGTRLDVQRRRDARRERRRRDKNAALAKMYGTGRMDKIGPTVQDIPRRRPLNYDPSVNPHAFFDIAWSLLLVLVSDTGKSTVPESRRVNAPGVVELSKNPDGTYE